MAIKEKSAVRSEIASSFPDNNKGEISAADIRTYEEDALDSNFYGKQYIASRSLVNVTSQWYRLGVISAGATFQSSISIQITQGATNGNTSGVVSAAVRDHGVDAGDGSVFNIGLKDLAYSVGSGLTGLRFVALTAASIPEYALDVEVSGASPVAGTLDINIYDTSEFNGTFTIDTSLTTQPDVPTGTETVARSDNFTGLLWTAPGISVGADGLLDFTNTFPIRTPRLTTTQRDAISTPLEGMTIFNTTTVSEEVYNGTAWISSTNTTIYSDDGEITANRSLLAEQGRSLIFRHFNLTAADFTQFSFARFDDTAMVLSYNDGDGVGGITGTRSISVDSAALTVTDTADSKGLVNAADYSANFTDRSLVDKEYVDRVKVIPVDSLSDLPTPVSDVIELTSGADFVYEFSCQTLALGANTFKATGGSVVIRGASQFATRLTSTSTAPLFDINECAFSSDRMSYTHSNGDIIDFDATVAGISCTFLNTAIFDCKSIGNINGAFTTSLRIVTIVKTTVGGLTWVGTLGSNVNIDGVFALSTALFGATAGWTGSLLDFGTSTSNSIIISSDSRFFTDAGNTAISGAVSNGNLTVTGRGVVSSNVFEGAGTFLSGWNEQDTRYLYATNAGLENSMNDAFASITTPASTTIGSIGVAVAIAGTFTSVNLHKFTVSSAGLLTYIGEDPITIPADFDVSIAPNSGSNIDMQISIAKNGTVLTESLQPVTASSGTPQQATTFTQVALVKNDTLQGFGQNDTNTTDITASTGRIRAD